MQIRDKFGRYTSDVKKIYYQSKIDKMSDTNVLETYSRLRSIKMQRLRRAFKSGRITKIPKIRTAKQLGASNVRKVLADFSKEVTPNSTTYLGEIQQANKTIKSLHANGLTFVNRKNLKSFGKFMNKIKDDYGIKAVDFSEKVAYMYKISKSKNICYNEIKKNFKKYLEMSTALMYKQDENILNSRKPVITRDMIDDVYKKYN